MSTLQDHTDGNGETLQVGPTAETRAAKRDAGCVKVAVAVLAVAFIATPVAYAAYEVYGLSAPAEASWRWPVILILAASFAVLSVWAVQLIHKSFPNP